MVLPRMRPVNRTHWPPVHPLTFGWHSIRFAGWLQRGDKAILHGALHYDKPEHNNPINGHKRLKDWAVVTISLSYIIDLRREVACREGVPMSG